MDFHILLSDTEYSTKPEKRKHDSSTPTLSSIPSGRHLRSSSSLKSTLIHTYTHTSEPNTTSEPIEPLSPDSPQHLYDSNCPPVGTHIARKNKKTGRTLLNNERNRVAKRRYVTRSTNGVSSSQSSSYSEDEEILEPGSGSSTSRYPKASSQKRRRKRYQSTVPSQSRLRQSLKLSSTFPLRRVPSIMDIFLDARSPSVDYDEEVFLEIADRSSLLLRRCDLKDYQFLDEHSLRVYWADQGRRARIWLGLGGGSSFTESFTQLTHLPDSFERSTATWTDTDTVNSNDTLSY